MNTLFPRASPRSAAHQNRPVNDLNVCANIIRDPFVECTERKLKKRRRVHVLRSPLHSLTYAHWAIT